MPSATRERCGYKLNIGLGENLPSIDECDRPVWGDNEKCIWHAKIDDKSVDDFEDYEPGPEEDLNGAYLRGAELIGVDWFSGASLIGADFADADVNGCDFSEADLTLASMKNVSALNVDFSDATLEGAIFTDGDLRRSTLEGAFLNDAVFTNVHIDNDTELGETSVYEKKGVEPSMSDDHPLEAASWAYRQLQKVYRSNSLPHLARRSYNQEKNARRKLAWTNGDYGQAIKWELSRWLMRYGNSPYRVLATSLLVITVAALLYPVTGGIQETQGEQVITYSIEDPSQAPQWWIVQVLFKSFYFSVVTFATLGYGDIQPVGTWARMLAGIETTIGTLLSALIVFVLTRLVTW